MIIISKFNKEYTINENLELETEDEMVAMDLDFAIAQYRYPYQGFKTSFVADQLKEMGYEIIKLVDEDMENSPDDRIY